MPQKPLDDLEPGMMLSQDVKSAEGRLLLPAGIVLVQHHLHILRQWQVAAVHVKVPGEHTPAGIGADTESRDPATHIRNERHLIDVFRLVDRSDPVMDPFFRFLLARLDNTPSRAGGGS
jgi:hypothetical protein